MLRTPIFARIWRKRIITSIGAGWIVMGQVPACSGLGMHAMKGDNKGYGGFSVFRTCRENLATFLTPKICRNAKWTPLGVAFSRGQAMSQEGHGASICPFGTLLQGSPKDSPSR
jgi:hypothetical protein